MAKRRQSKGSVWFRKSCGAWYTGLDTPLRDEAGNLIKGIKVDGVWQPTPESEARAQIAQGLLILNGPKEAPKPTEASPTVNDVFQAFLAKVERQNSAKYLLKCIDFLKDFNEFIGGKAVLFSALTGRELGNWIESRRTVVAKKKLWSDTHCHDAGTVVKAACNFGVDEGLIKVNPFKKTSLPKSKTRGNVRLSAAHEALLFKYAPKYFADYCRVLMETGARPNEIGCLEARHFEQVPQGLLATLAPHEWKNGLKTGQHRFIKIKAGSKSEAIIKEKMAEHPKGKLFWNCTGPLDEVKRCEVWRNMRDAIQKVEGAEAFPNKFTLYSLRHTYISRKSVDTKVEIIADNTGTSPTQIYKTYRHATDTELWGGV